MKEKRATLPNGLAKAAASLLLRFFLPQTTFPFCILSFQWFSVIKENLILDFFSLYSQRCFLQGELFKDRATAMHSLLQRGDETALDQVLLKL